MIVLAILYAGVIPLLGAPMQQGTEGMLADAVDIAVKRGLVQAKQHIVCVMSVRNDLVLKVVSVDDFGQGISQSIATSGERLLDYVAYQTDLY